jgi:hypothetical protein
MAHTCGLGMSKSVPGALVTLSTLLNKLPSSQLTFFVLADSMLVEIVLLVFLLFLSYRWSQAKYQANIPRLGPPTVLGYLWTLFRFVLHPRELLAEGRIRFSGRPFVVPMLMGPVVIVGKENVESLRSEEAIVSSPALAARPNLLTTKSCHQYLSQFNQPAAVNHVSDILPCRSTILSMTSTFEQMLAFPQTLHDGLLKTTMYEATVMRTDVTRALPILIPEIVEETSLAFGDALNFSEGSGMCSL